MILIFRFRTRTRTRIRLCFTTVIVTMIDHQMFSASFVQSSIGTSVSDNRKYHGGYIRGQLRNYFKFILYLIMEI